MEALIKASLHLSTTTLSEIKKGMRTGAFSKNRKGGKRRIRRETHGY